MLRKGITVHESLLILTGAQTSKTCVYKVVIYTFTLLIQERDGIMSALIILQGQ